MPLELPAILLALAILLTVASGLWLMLNARAVARLFQGSGVIDPGPGPRRASRRTTFAILIAFNIGWIASIAIWAWAMTGEANEAVLTDAV